MLTQLTLHDWGGTKLVPVGNSQIAIGSRKRSTRNGNPRSDQVSSHLPPLKADVALAKETVCLAVRG